MLFDAKDRFRSAVSAAVAALSSAETVELRQVAFMCSEPKSKIPVGNLFLSTRKRFKKGDHGWPDYLPPSVSQVCTIDSFVNRHTEDSGYLECSPETIDASLELLPIPSAGDEYYQLAINRNGRFAEFIPIGWRLLGHDLSDETRTSSLHNCGPWTGPLSALIKRLNGAGLLSWEDAQAAQGLLPKEWGEGVDHAHVVIWALYQRI